MKLLIATGNKHKVREISSLLEGMSVELLSLADFPDIPEVVEDGVTLEENASKKALQPAQASGLWTLADDTGLEVDALGGAPGVYSARYAGEGCDFSANTQKLLKEMDGIAPEKRTAAFRTVVALSSPDGDVRCVEGRLEGRISEEASGSEGFGYDPVFLIPDLGKTLAEISAEKKNSISHRGRAIRAILPEIKKILAAACLGLCIPLISFATPAQGGPAAPIEIEISGERRAELARERARLSGDLARAPKDVEGWRRLGFIHQALGEPEAALLAFSKVTELNPSDPAGWYMLALVYEKLERPHDAIDAWEKCLREVQSSGARARSGRTDEERARKNENRRILETAQKHLRILRAR